MVSSPKVSVIVGTCSVDNVMVALYYEKPLVCFETSWRESGLAESLMDAGLGITLWPISTSSAKLQDSISNILEIKPHIMSMIAKYKKTQTVKGNAPLEEMAIRFLDHGTSTKKKVPDPVNHGIEFAVVLVTFLMLIRFFFRTGRKVFSNPKAQSKPRVKDVPKTVDDKKKKNDAPQKNAKPKKDD